MGSVVRKLDDDLRKLATAALQDERFGALSPTSPAAVAVSVSLLFNPLELGEASPEEILPYYKCGEQVLMAYRGESLGLLLPFVASTHNLDSLSFAEAVVEKAELTEPPYYWCRLDSTTWLDDGERAHVIIGGFPQVRHSSSASEEQLTQYASWHSDYLVRQQRSDGSFYSSYEPFQDVLHEEANPARMAHAAWVAARGAQVLARPDLMRVAQNAVDHLVLMTTSGEDGYWISADETPSISEVAFLLLALCYLPENNPQRVNIESLTEALTRTVWSAARQPHGRILTHRDPAAAEDCFQDYFPGQVLLALAAVSEKDQSQLDDAAIHRCFKYYRHRFRYQRHFGQVSWLMQAFSRWWQVTRDASFADFVFEIGEWILSYQQVKAGAFINDHQADTPGYTTAVYLEGIGAAMRLAAGLGDEERFATYQHSFAEGYRFLDRLIIQPRDAAVLPRPEFALGGLREGIYFSRIRLDFVQHSLSAILEWAEARSPTGV
jgi:hypothetical protein